MQVIPGSNRYTIKANWKLLAENSIDGYHALPTHQTYFDYMANEAGGGLASIANRRGFGRVLGNGHGVMENDAAFGRPIAMWHPYFGEDAKDDIRKIKDDLIARHGQEKALRMCEKSRNMVIFPNLVINDIMAVTIRAFQPTGPGGMDVTAWEMAPGGRDREPVAAPAGLVPDVPRAGRFRDSGRRRGAGILSAGVPFRRRGMVGPFAGVPPRPQGDR